MIFDLASKSYWRAALLFSCLLSLCRAGEARDCIVLPSATNAVRMRLCTNASPESAHLFNTIEIEAFGATLLQSPGGDWKQWLARSPSNATLHNILVNDAGPNLASTNGATLIDQAAGPEWCYVVLDLTAAYRDRLEQYRRGILFVEPDLFVVYDHIQAKERVNFRMLLHPPAATRVDAGWGDLRLNLPEAAFRIHSPGAKRRPRSWEQVESPVDQLLQGTATMQLGPTNKLGQLELLTVFAVQRGTDKRDYAFQLVESDSSVGARIHRDGLPTLIAFKTDLAATRASLSGFGYNGPVGVDVYRPKKKAP